MLVRELGKVLSIFYVYYEFLDIVKWMVYL